MNISPSSIQRLVRDAWRTNGLARRLAVVVILFSSLITTVLTGIELSKRYYSDIDGIRARFDFIAKSYSPALAASVWVIDEAQVQTQLEGLLRLQDIESLSITTPAAKGAATGPARPRWSAGKTVSSRVLTHTVPLLYEYRGQMQMVGELSIVGSVDKVLDRIWTALIGILLDNGIKTLLVATFLLVVFQLVVGNHLEHLASHVRGLGASLAASGDVVLQRKAGGRWRPDALDHLERSLNETRRSLIAVHDDLRESNEKLEQRVRERTTELERVNAELEAFSYSVAHDLRAPLRHVMGFSKILEERLGPTLTDENRKYFGIVTKSAQRMNHLVEDLLELARVGRAPLTKGIVDLHALTEEVLADLRPEIGDRSIDLRIGTLPPVTADRSLLRQVLVNLLSNAVKYTRNTDGTCIEVGVLPKDGSQGVHTFFVRDNGVGFDMEYAANLFQPFTRLHSESEFEGSGIGLSIVGRVIERHGGKAWAQGEKDRGATVFFSLPG